MEDELTPEDIRLLRNFKSTLFNLYWEQFGFFYIHVFPHPELKMGTRGLVGKEAEAGVILAFGPNACKEVSAESDYLYAELQFGLKWEKLFIPWDSVFRIFDKAQNSLVQLRVIKDAPTFTSEQEKPGKPKKHSDSKVIEIDFTRKK